MFWNRYFNSPRLKHCFGTVAMSALLRDIDAAKLRDVN